MNLTVKFLQPKKITIEDKEFIISKVPAFDAVTLFTDLELVYNGATGGPELQDLRKQKLKEAFSFCGVEIDDKLIPLNTKTLIDQHLGGADYAITLLKELTEYNMGFLKKKGGLM